VLLWFGLLYLRINNLVTRNLLRAETFKRNLKNGSQQILFCPAIAKRKGKNQDFMKLKPKNILKLFTIGTVFVLTSCQKDLYEGMNKPPIVNTNIKTYFITGQSAKLAAEKLGEHIGKSLPTKGNAIESDGTKINYESVMVVENELHDKAYTFKVDSPVETELKFQNMALIEKNTSTVAKLITYEMTPAFAYNYYADRSSMVDFKGTVTITTISNTSQNCCGAPGASQTVVIGGGDPSGTNEPGTYNNPNGSNGSSGGWGLGWGGTSSGGGSSSGGSSTSNNNGGSIIQMCPSGMHTKGDPVCRYTPKAGGTANVTFSNRYNAGGYVTNVNPNDLTFCCIVDIGLYQDILFQDNCNTLIDLVTNPNKPSLKPEIDYLKSELDNPNLAVEHGVEFKVKHNSDDTYTYNYDRVVSPNPRNVPLYTGLNYYGAAHLHIGKGGASIFSYGDLRWLVESYEGARTLFKKDVTYMLAVKNPTTGVKSVYALKVNDIDLFKQNVDAVWNNQKYATTTNEDDKMRKINKDLAVKYSESADVEKTFLQLFGNDGLSLYKAKNDALDNWDQLNLETSTDPTTLGELTVTKKPCKN
jgi:hypothetical protein